MREARSTLEMAHYLGGELKKLPMVGTVNAGLQCFFSYKDIAKLVYKVESRKLEENQKKEIKDFARIQNCLPKNRINEVETKLDGEDGILFNVEKYVHGDISLLRRLFVRLPDPKGGYQYASVIDGGLVIE